MCVCVCVYIFKLELYIYIYIYNSTELSIDWTSREFQNQTILFLRKVKSSI